MDLSFLILSSIGIILLSIFLIPLLPIKHKSTGAINLVFITAILSTFLTIKVLYLHSTLKYSYTFSHSLGTLYFQIDALSAWFICIINIISVAGAFYGKGYLVSYLKENANTTIHWILFVILQNAMLWVCMANQALLFLIAWEVMSLSALILIILEHEKPETLKAGLNYLIQAHIGVILLTVGFIWVYISEKSFHFDAIMNFFTHHSPIGLSLIFFIGFGIKAGFVPLHTWLPHAHPAAPSHVSGIMSGIVVKMGIYGILRMITFLSSDLLIIGVTFLIISLITAIYGILNAAVHRDFKRMLAYCTIENIGIIGIGLAIGLIGKAIGNYQMSIIGFSAVLLHSLNHALYKALLFFTAGNVYQQTHTRDMEKLGGLIKSMPQTAIFFLIGGIAISGLPPFNGFISEFLIYSGLLIGIKTMSIAYITVMIFSIASLAIVGGISMLTFTKVFGTIFLGSPRTHLHQQPKEVINIMRFPQYFILLIMITIGVFPKLYLTTIGEIVGSFIPMSSIRNTSLFDSYVNSLTIIGWLGLVFILLISVVLYVRHHYSSTQIKIIESTWGCGYGFPTSKMQYTGKSFSKSLGKLLNFIVIEKKKYNEISMNEIFPKIRKHSSHYKDFIEIEILNPFLDRLLLSLNYFKFIQNGNIQLYILYGIFFVGLVFLGTILKFI
jgi:formate hydrogenlyase subunit 3/multisubunit Na+/H+ antiporter MnhD subunit